MALYLGMHDPLIHDLHGTSTLCRGKSREPLWILTMKEMYAAESQQTPCHGSHSRRARISREVDREIIETGFSEGILEGINAFSVECRTIDDPIKPFRHLAQQYRLIFKPHEVAHKDPADRVGELSKARRWSERKLRHQSPLAGRISDRY